MRSCGGCNERKADEEFGVRDRATGREHTICRECRRTYCRTHYRKDPQSFYERKKARAQRYRARARSLIDAYLAAHPCVDCGEADPIVLEFDHVRDVKARDVSALAYEGAPEARIVAEIAKCDVRCANCHRRRTATELWGRKSSFVGRLLSGPSAR